VQVAGAKKFSARGLCRGARLVAVTSGANMDFHDLARVAAAAAPAAAPTPRAAQGGVGAEVVSFWF
jgi:threonine dehydratase